jgi:hypothetical protein
MTFAYVKQNNDARSFRPPSPTRHCCYARLLLLLNGGAAVAAVDVSAVDDDRDAPRAKATTERMSKVGLRAVVLPRVPLLSSLSCHRKQFQWEPTTIHSH